MTFKITSLVSQSQFQFARFWDVSNGERDSSFAFHNFTDSRFETAATFDVRNIVGDQIFGDIGNRMQVLIVHVIFQNEQTARLDE